MATPPSLPFAVRIYFKPDSEDSRVGYLGSFTLDEKAAEPDRLVLTEYRDYDLEFVSLHGEPPEDARLYIDGFDALVHPDLVTDGGSTYVPCGKRIKIGRYNETDFPWIPGSYRVRVDWDGTSYYDVLNVRPKDLSDEELRVMRKELEQYVVGLTLDLIRKNQGIGQSDFASRLPVRFYQYQLLEKHFARLNETLLDLLRRPKHEVRKIHEVVSAHNSHEADSGSYRWLNSYAGYSRNAGRVDKSVRNVLAPKRIVDYDLPENRWVKRILLSLIGILEEIANSLEVYIQLETGRLQETELQLAKVRRLQARLRLILNDPLFEEVTVGHGVLPYTPALRRDGRYRMLYQFWWDLVHHSEIKVEASFEYQWKKTDLLWEYWSFAKTLQALQKLDFQPESGWIYDERWQFPERVFIPSIPPGTKVTMCRNNGSQRIEVYYNQRLPHSGEEAQRNDSPVFVEGSHDRPDVRIDCYTRDEYCFSLIVEAKYRKACHIWNSALKDDHAKWTSVMDQLRAYWTDVTNVADRMRRAVKNVIVLYPRGNLNNIHDTGRYITLVHLVPGGSDDHYVRCLGELLEVEGRTEK